MLDIDSRDETPLPCADAMVAGTVALMTAWASPCPACSLGIDQQRYLLTHKVMCNLLLLQRHPALSPGLRQVMAQAHQRWAEIAAASEVDLGIDRSSTHDDDRSDSSAMALH